MKTLVLAAILAALALPMHAQESPARAGKTTAQAEQGKTPREKARLAKAQNKDAKCATPKQKKAAAT